MCHCFFLNLGDNTGLLPKKLLKKFNTVYSDTLCTGGSPTITFEKEFFVGKLFSETGRKETELRIPGDNTGYYQKKFSNLTRHTVKLV